jgi:hypothetical protein
MGSTGSQWAAPTWYNMREDSAIYVVYDNVKILFDHMFELNWFI